ncbi:hypothetical protein ACFRQM_35655 [Streptomyces sp. NPDC056831]|uniref:hypothetical protein n=1 Tax=Streptomyces sp. NPDC056831 TaxID=3345954 RepID=UPI0036782953
MPFGFIALPPSSQVGLPFQVAETCCGGVAAAGTVQLLIGGLPALTVTCPMDSVRYISPRWSTF